MPTPGQALSGIDVHSMPLWFTFSFLMGISQADQSGGTAGASDASSLSRPDCRELSKQMEMTKEGLDSLGFLKQKMDSLQNLSKRYCPLPEALPDAPLQVKAFRSDSTQRSDFTPSYLGGELSGKYSPIPVLTFTIYQGLSSPYWHTRSWFYSGALKAAYHGAYDFDSRNRSGPVISRFQNPQVFVENYFDSIGGTGWSNNLYAGWAHESNGQFLETARCHPPSARHRYGP